MTDTIKNESRPLVSVVLPCLNEEAAIGAGLIKDSCDVFAGATRW